MRTGKCSVQGERAIEPQDSNKGCKMKMIRSECKNKSLVCIQMRGMGNKQDELKTIACEKSYDLIAIGKTWWDSYFNCNIKVEGYTFFLEGKDGGRRGKVVVSKIYTFVLWFRRNGVIDHNVLFG